jgi:serine/threonine protein kinase
MSLSDTPTIPGYTIIGLAGSGAQGQVFEAVHDHTGLRVAIKVLPVATTSQEPTAFTRELNSLAELRNHPNVVTLFDVVQIPDAICVVVTWCKQGPIGRDLPARQVASFGVLLGGALVTAASHRIFHGDIKPDNVLMDNLRQPRLADFGVATIPGLPSHGLTRAYSAPERLPPHFQELDELCDQFSLASTLRTICRSSELSRYPKLDETLAMAASARRHDRFPTTRLFVEALRSFEADQKWSVTKPIWPETGAEETLFTDQNGNNNPDPAPWRHESLPNKRKRRLAVGLGTIGVVVPVGIGVFLRSIRSSSNRVPTTTSPATAATTPKVAASSEAKPRSTRQIANETTSARAGSTTVGRTRQPLEGSLRFVLTEGVESQIVSDGGPNIARLAPISAAAERCEHNPRPAKPCAVVVALRDANGSTTRQQLALVDDAGSTIISDGTASDRAPAVSPDGRRIAFSSDRNGNRDIYLVDLTGEHLTRLTSTLTVDDEPSWSPDGKEIVWVSGSSGQPSLNSMNITTRAAKVVSETSTAWESPTFSPDGKFILALQTAGRTRRVVRIDLTTGATKVLPRGQGARSPIWRSASTAAFIALNPGRSATIVTIDVESEELLAESPAPVGVTALVRPQFLSSSE